MATYVSVLLADGTPPVETKRCTADDGIVAETVTAATPDSLPHPGPWFRRGVGLLPYRILPGVGNLPWYNPMRISRRVSRRGQVLLLMTSCTSSGLVLTSPITVPSAAAAMSSTPPVLLVFRDRRRFKARAHQRQVLLTWVLEEMPFSHVNGDQREPIVQCSPV